MPDCVNLEEKEAGQEGGDALLNALVNNLHLRFKKDHIYTNIGPVLLSINPHKKVHLYSPDVIDVYRCHCLYELPPHIYAVTDRAWRTLREMNSDQNIVITGEAGSGKTEAAKLTLHYLAAVTSHAPECHTIKYQILQSNPVLEAFGNAKTRLNENSSRFGKYLDISFDFKGDPLGGLITTYLLEKSRVTRHCGGERNFHIFYQLIQGADVHLLKELRLQRQVDNYSILRENSDPGQQKRKGQGQPDSSAATAVPSSLEGDPPVPSTSNSIIDDKKDFNITRKALEDLGMTPDEILQVFRLVASILKLGNLNFVPTTNMDGTEGCGISNDYELYEVCDNLDSDFEILQNALVTRTIEGGRNEYLMTDLSAQEAANGRDSLCRALYSRLFTWIVNRTNESIKVKTPQRHKTLGILDLYGFEASLQNGFEQLVINYANEKLATVTTEWGLGREQAEYASEGIEWSHIDYFQNTAICDLFEKNNFGLISLLDEVTLKRSVELLASGSVCPNLDLSSSIDAGDSDSTVSNSTVCSPSALLSSRPPSSGALFIQRLQDVYGDRHPHLEVLHRPDSAGKEEPLKKSGSGKRGVHCFKIKHFAGTVKYDARDFVIRNLDSLDKDLSTAMYACNHPLLKVLFPEGNPRRTTRRRPATAGTQFKIAIGSLVNNLRSRTPHFVHCIKPNEMRQPRMFEPTIVKHQVSYQGLSETLQLRRNGFAYRMEYGQFLKRYKMLSAHTWPHWRGPSVEGVTYLLREIPISANEYAFGRTKIFIRSVKTAEMLEEARREKIDDLATLIQKTFRGHANRTKWSRLKDSTMVISTYWKRWKDKSNILELKQRRKEEWATLIIQKFYRAWLHRKFLLRLAHNLPSESPLSKEWPSAPRYLRESNVLLRRLYHKWRCHRYRLRFDQIARNRMREKVTASIIFKERKASYPRSVRTPFYGDYVSIRRNPAWKETLKQNHLSKRDKHVVFADVVNKMNRSTGKFVPILFVISTSSMLIMDQRTMQIKYRIPASEIFKLSLSPYFDDIAVFHVRATSPTREMRSQANIPGCLSSETIKRKGDFVLQTGHVIEIVTKLFLVVQNATGKPPNINISTEIEANFGADSVPFTFRPANGAKDASNSGGSSTTSSATGTTNTTTNTTSSGQYLQSSGGPVKLVKRANKFEVIV